MKKIALVGTVAVMLFAFALSAQAQFTPYEEGQWRIGVSWATLSDSASDDALGSGFGVNVEYYFARILEGALGATLGYKTFEEGANDLDYWDLGVKWRGGPGGMRNMDGFYYGWGLALAFLDANSGALSDDSTELEWELLAGVDFAETWYGEVTYEDPGDVLGFDASSWTFTVGYRF